ncbi:hypothetical protein AB0M83_21300 [Amycolatopsis sp. NPDC051106]|uniref:hypothetical protein n=1 Tax=unclassified Amycolatopsis TaxID=2618356 RepID=UPI003440F757
MANAVAVGVGAILGTWGATFRAAFLMMVFFLMMVLTPVDWSLGPLSVHHYVEHGNDVNVAPGSDVTTGRKLPR